MSHVLEYTLSLQDQVSAKLKAIGVSNDTALAKFSSVQKKVNEVNSTFNSLGSSIFTLKQRIDVLQQERDIIPEKNLRDIRVYNTEIEKLQQKITKLSTTNSDGFMKKNLSGIMNAIPGGSLLANPMFATGAIVAGAFREGFRQDMQSVAFETLLGSKLAGNKMFGEIRKFAAATPYETLPLADNAKMMLGFGIAQEKIMPNLKMLGDISMGDSNKMQSLTLAFSQANAAGRLMGQDLLQMINAGFNPLQEISKNTGKSMSLLRKEMESGKISIKMVQQAFESATAPGGRFYGMTEKMGNSPFGKWSTFIDNFKLSLLRIYEVLSPLVIPALELGNKVLSLIVSTINVVVNSFSWLWKKINEGNVVMGILSSIILGVATSFAIMTTWSKISAYWLAQQKAATITYRIAVATATLFTHGWTAAQQKLNLALTINPIGLIIAAIIALIGIILYVIYKTDGWAKQWESVVNFMKYTFQAYVESVKFLWNTAINAVMIGVDKIKLAWYKLKNAIGIGDKSENEKAIAQIRSDMEARKNAMIDGAKKVLELHKKAKESLKWELSWNSDRKLSDITKGIKEKLGIKDTTTTVTAKTSTGSSSIMDTADSITSGGSRPTTINISLGKLLENVVINSQTVKEGASDMEKIVVETLLRVLNSGNAIAGR